MTGRDEVQRLVAVITMDCYNLAEQVTAFYETFAEEVPVPTTATVIGTTVEVVGIDIADHGEVLTARCHRGDVVQDLHLSDAIERFTNSTSRSRDHILPSDVASSRWAYRAAVVRARAAIFLVCSFTP